MNSEAMSYVLITPARNEAAFIGETIDSVISQTVLPLKWVIVDDGSTDSTPEIVAVHSEANPWIKLVRMPAGRTRDFAAKVRAFNAGLGELGDLSWEVIGNLDADISFEPDYFASLLGKLAEDKKLGVVGTPFVEDGKSYDYRFTSIEHVSGACQLFRRECFEAVGGYVPSAIGGVDLVAVITARMKGWKTRSFVEKTCTHHRNMGKGKHGRLLTAFNGGRGDYMLGGAPLWEVCRSFYQMSRRPFLLGGSMRLLGYTWAALTGAKKQVSGELIKFRRAEQMRRLKRFWRQLTNSAKPEYADY